MVTLSELTSDQIKTPFDRLQLIGDPNNDFNLSCLDNWFNDIISPANPLDKLSQYKLYLIAEDNCFDHLGLTYTNGIIKDKLGNPISEKAYEAMIDTYRHTYISAMYDYKYGSDTAHFVMDAKEHLDGTNELREHIKDFNNNAVGREIGDSVPKFSSFENANNYILQKVEEAYNDPTKLVKDPQNILNSHLDRLGNEDWEVLRCRSKEKGDALVQQVNDITNGAGIRISPSNLKSVNYSSLLEQAQAQANGTATSIVDKFIPQGTNVPLPAAGGTIPTNLGGGTIGGSPTAPNIIYTVTTMPTGGGGLGIISALIGAVLGGVARSVFGPLVGGDYDNKVIFLDNYKMRRCAWDKGLQKMNGLDG